MIDALGEILTEEEIKFLAEILLESWYALDVRNMSNEKRKMYSSIKSKISRLNNNWYYYISIYVKINIRSVKTSFLNSHLFNLKMNKRLKKLFKDYDDNLLNYFAGLSPKQSKDFNKLVKENKKKWF